MLNSSITQLIIGTAVMVGMSVIAISAVAQSPVEATQEALTNRSTSPSSETEFRLSDHQQLKGYFLDGPFRVSPSHTDDVESLRRRAEQAVAAGRRDQRRANGSSIKGSRCRPIRPDQKR